MFACFVLFFLVPFLGRVRQPFFFAFFQALSLVYVDVLLI